METNLGIIPSSMSPVTLLTHFAVTMIASPGKRRLGFVAPKSILCWSVSWA